MKEWYELLDFTGRSVLDIGGYDGRWSADALKRGAASAVVVDNGEWEAYGWGAPGTADARIVFERGDLFDLKEPADVVLCGNVLYHVKRPLDALQTLRRLAAEALVLRTSFVVASDLPDGWKWYPDGSGHPNGTVWNRPTLPALERELGGLFARVERANEAVNDQAVYVCMTR